MGCQSVTERCWKIKEGQARPYQTHNIAGEPDIRRKTRKMVAQPGESPEKTQWKSQNIGSDYKDDADILARRMLVTHTRYTYTL